MSAGPILAVMLMSIISGQKNIQGEVSNIVAEGVFGPIISKFPESFLNPVALLPIIVLFLIFNFLKFKLSKDDLSGIIIGLMPVAGACNLPISSTFWIYGYGTYYRYGAWKNEPLDFSRDRLSTRTYSCTC